MTSRAELVHQGEYGIVVATRGPHAGRVGYYDDDELRGVAIVYFEGEPLLTPYVLVKRAALRSATPTEAKAWRRTRADSRENAALAGTPSNKASLTARTSSDAAKAGKPRGPRPTVH